MKAETVSEKLASLSDSEKAEFLENLIGDVSTVADGAKWHKERRKLARDILADLTAFVENRTRGGAF